METECDEAIKKLGKKGAMLAKLAIYGNQESSRPDQPNAEYIRKGILETNPSKGLKLSAKTQNLLEEYCKKLLQEQLDLDWSFFWYKDKKSFTNLPRLFIEKQ